jgi:hypothetical protein
LKECPGNKKKGSRKEKKIEKEKERKKEQSIQRRNKTKYQTSLVFPLLSNCGELSDQVKIYTPVKTQELKSS